MRSLFRSLIIAALMISSCTSTKKGSNSAIGPSFDLQGHRGARGLMPENTIPAMKVAIDHGVTTVELDVVISKDNKVVVSHDPYFNELITTTPEGKHLTKKEAEELVLYQMMYDEIKKYDVGLKPHPNFPKQQKIKVHKPLLSELIDSVEDYAKSKGKSIRYNIEIKSKKSGDGVNHPAPENFSELVLAVIKGKNILNRTTIQSFDIRPLQYIHKAHPVVTLSYLVEKTTQSIEDQFAALGFQPQTYSPNYAILTKEAVAYCHQRKIKVLPWTVNNLSEMNKLIELGVDGIISDYPDLFAQLGVRK
ncbi:MAG TPA: glycerophosphodiester phosphodiesterase [Segetibacter sp.]|jgi:glycerophosphoryl diester phosphodiesterase